LILRASYPEMEIDIPPILFWSFVGIFLAAFAVLKIKGAREG